MRRQDELLREDDGLFGPGWDLAIALIAVLVLCVGLEAAAREKVRLDQRQGDLVIHLVRERQLHLVDQLAAHYHVQRTDLGGGTYAIYLSRAAAGPDILIHDDASLQRISFGNHLLFESDGVVLLPGGVRILAVVAAVLRGELDHLMEIQIQGHADLLKPKAFDSNLKLAAERAISVYRALEGFGIDPAQSVMSATSFGDTVPVTRSRTDTTYTRARLIADNDNPDKMRLNRRIEVVLIYRLDTAFNQP